MSARMEKTRELIERHALQGPWKAAARAEVEEWEDIREGLERLATFNGARRDAAEAERDRLRAAARSYLDQQQKMKGAVLTGGDFLFLAQAEDNLRAALNDEGDQT